MRAFNISKSSGHEQQTRFSLRQRLPAQVGRQVAGANRSRPWLMNGGTASEAQRWDEGAKRPKGLKGQACLRPEQLLLPEPFRGASVKKTKKVL